MSAESLWCAVLEMAISDALYGEPTSAYTGRGRDAKQRHWRLKINSDRAYITTLSSDLIQVCINAGIDPSIFVERMSIVVAEAPTPEELLAMTRKQKNALVNKRSFRHPSERRS